MRPAALAALVLLVLSGCAVEDDDAKRPPAARVAGETGESKAIRAWSRALNDGEYGRAAAFFAPGALVEQVETIRLRDRAAAVAFNRSLPCRADVTDLEDEGSSVLAAFRLRDGPGGPCQGAARVRFRFRAGKFSEWRQLGAPARAPSEIARGHRSEPGGGLERRRRHREGRDASLG